MPKSGDIIIYSQSSHISVNETHAKTYNIFTYTFKGKAQIYLDISYPSYIMFEHVVRSLNHFLDKPKLYSSL